MSPSRPLLPRSYPVRSFSTRRPRPSVASIADVFVGSLVLAGFCHEHSPRGQTFSTLAIRASEPNLRELRKSSRQYSGAPPTQRHLGISGYAVQQSRRGSWFSHALAASESSPPENPKSPSSTKEDETKDKHYVLPRLPEVPDTSSHSRLEDRFFDSISGNEGPSASANKESSSKDTEETTGVPSEPAAYGRRDKKVRAAIASMLDRLFGTRFDWADALEAMAPLRKVKRENDGSRDALESLPVARLVDALPSSERSSEQYLFRLYRQIPAPGILYLSKASRATLLRRLATPPNRRPIDVRRFLAVVDDMIATGLPMSRSLWSSAIHMAGRSIDGKLSKRRLVKAVGLWQHMEHVAGIKADAVTFNILFEIATKANQFIVADRLEEEMKNRRIAFSRMGRVSKIYACGMRKDVPGIRENFNKFVAAGDLVDTVVLNCLMAAFLRAGDTETAEQLYAQMLQTQVKENRRSSRSKKVSSKDQPSLSPELTFYRAKSRRLARVLSRSKGLRYSLPAFHRELQESLSLVPDTRTFYIWLQHCVRVTGDLNMFMNVLQDMEKVYDIPPRYLIYLLLFEGFATHGRRRKKVWTAEKLRLTWVSFLQAVRDSSLRRTPSDSDRPSMIWENPLEFAHYEHEASDLETSTDPDDLYMSLPSAGSRMTSFAPKKSSIDLIDPLDFDSQDTQDLPLEFEGMASHPPKTSSIDLVDPAAPQDNMEKPELGKKGPVNFDPQHNTLGSPLEGEFIDLDLQEHMEDMEIGDEESVFDDALGLEEAETENESISGHDVYDDAIGLEGAESKHDSLSDHDQNEEDLADMNSGGKVPYKRGTLTPEEEADIDRPHHEYLAHRLENGVFVGRRMITQIIRAFGTCLGPSEVLEAWLQLEQLWRPSKRRVGDVLAVKEVVDEEMARRPKT